MSRPLVAIFLVGLGVLALIPEHPQVVRVVIELVPVLVVHDRPVPEGSSDLLLGHPPVDWGSTIAEPPIPLLVDEPSCHGDGV